MTKLIKIFEINRIFDLFDKFQLILIKWMGFANKLIKMDLF